MGYWRAAAIFCLLLLLVAAAAGVSMFEQFKAQVADLQHKIQNTSQLQYLSVLVDEKGEPTILLTQMSGEPALQFQRLNALVEGPEDTMQLWAVPETGPAHSLGILQAKIKTPSLPASDQTLANVTHLAISVENKGGVTDRDGPRLPYLLTGRVIRKAI
jgi:anti-sigma-K factor RskA